jgi:hypothetical protein
MNKLSTITDSVCNLYHGFSEVPADTRVLVLDRNPRVSADRDEKYCDDAQVIYDFLVNNLPTGTGEKLWKMIENDWHFPI